jgi:hypothetical protein
MRTYRITIQNDISKKKRRVNVQGHNINNAIDYADYHKVHHASEEIIKIERWDDRK